MKKVVLFVVCFIILAMVMSKINAQSISLSGESHDINPGLYGYNPNLWLNGPNWDNEDFRYTSGRLNSAVMRYPGGTIANYWDWRTGNIMNTLTTGWPKYLGDDYTATPADIVQGIPKGVDIVYCVNLARPTPATGVDPYSSVSVLQSQATLDKKITDILQGINAFYQAGHNLKYVEIGNEFYHGAVGGVDEQGSIYTGNSSLYINHANQLASAIHTAYPNIKMAVIGDANDSDSQTATPWTQAIYDAISSKTLNNIDAITFHWYSGPGAISQLTNATEAMKSLAQAYNAADKKLSRDYNHVPSSLEIWATEYNTWSDPAAPVNGGPIQGTWVNGMFGANLALQYVLMGSKVTMLNYHALALGNNVQWAALYDESTLSGNGAAMGLLGNALNGMTKVENLSYTNIPDMTFTNGWPSLVGGKFSNQRDKREAVVIINNTDKQKIGVDISALFTGTGEKFLSQYYDTTPWNSIVTEINGVTYNRSYSSGNTITIPAFSITVITQENENLINNPGFEDVNSTDWTYTNQTISNARRNANTGYYSMLLNTTSQGWASASQSVALVENTKYRLSAKIRTKLTQGQGRLLVAFYNGSGTEIGSREIGNGFSGTMSYVTSELEFTTPASCATASIQLQLANGTGSCWFDDIVLKKISSVNDADISNYWSFDTDANDQVGSVNGVLKNGASIQSNGIVNGALNFDGYNDWLELNHNDLKDEFTKYTVAFWMKPDRTTGIQYLYEEGGASNGFAIRLNESTLEACMIEGGGGEANTKIASRTGFYNGFWYFVCVTYDNGTLKLYKNDVTPYVKNTGFGTFASHGNAAAIGGINSQALYHNAGDYYFEGKIDEFKIFDGVALTDAQVLDLYGEWSYLKNGQISTEFIESVDDSATEEVMVYPNPLHGTTVYFSQSIEQVRVFNLSGSQILHVADCSSMDVSTLQKGVYILDLDGTKIKLIKK